MIFGNLCQSSSFLLVGALRRCISIFKFINISAGVGENIPRIRIVAYKYHIKSRIFHKHQPILLSAWNGSKHHFPDYFWIDWWIIFHTSQNTNQKSDTMAVFSFLFMFWVTIALHVKCVLDSLDENTKQYILWKCHVKKNNTKKNGISDRRKSKASTHKTRNCFQYLFPQRPNVTQKNIYSQLNIWYAQRDLLIRLLFHPRDRMCSYLDGGRGRREWECLLLLLLLFWHIGSVSRIFILFSFVLFIDVYAR